MTTHRPIRDLLDLLERDPSLRNELERAGAQGDTEFAQSLRELGKRTGIAITENDAQSLLSTARSLTRAPSELEERELEGVTGGSGVTESAELINSDLQQALQRQQQTLQTLSNIIKLQYETSTAITRKLGG